jgi:hypothetical protein
MLSFIGQSKLLLRQPKIGKSPWLPPKKRDAPIGLEGIANLEGSVNDTVISS